MAGKRRELDLDKVRELAAQGLSQKQISSMLGISDQTFLNRKKEDLDFLAAYEEGKLAGIQQVANACFEGAKTGNASLIQYYLKVKDPENWNPTEKTENTSNVTLEVGRDTRDELRKSPEGMKILKDAAKLLMKKK